MTTPPDPYRCDVARALAAENRELRELLEAVAQELERLAGHASPPTTSRYDRRPEARDQGNPPRPFVLAGSPYEP